MSPVLGTPSPEPECSPSSSMELPPHSPPTASRRDLIPAIAHGLGDRDNVTLTSLSGHDLSPKHYQMPQIPTWPSPFDSPTSDKMSSSASENLIGQRCIVRSVRMTVHPPDWRLSAWGTPSRSSSKKEGRAQQTRTGGTFVGYGNRPEVIRFYEKDPVRRFLAEELHQMADNSPSQNNVTPSRSPTSTTPRFPNQTPTSHKRSATTVENEDRDLDEDWIDTKLVPGMAEFKLSRRSPTPMGRPSKKAKNTEAGSDNKGITDCPKTSH